MFPAPVGYWPFDDQGAVTTADLSAGAHPGNINGTATYVTGHTGAATDFAINFNGTDTAVTTLAPLLDGLDSFTMAGWVKFTAPQVRPGFFGVNDTAEFGMSNATTIAMWAPTGGQMERAFDSDGGQWQHIVVVADSAGRRLYRNGELYITGSVATPTASLAGSFNIGGGGIWDPTGNFFNGQIDDVAVWTAPLSGSEVSLLYRGEITPLGPPGTGELVITGIVFNAEFRDVSVTFSSLGGKHYALEYKTAGLSGPWLEARDVIATGPETTMSQFNIPAAATSRFYRVRLIPPVGP